MKIPLPKLKAMLLFFATYTDEKFLGKVKLMKLFYFADFLHLKKYGLPITYDTYAKFTYGPVPLTILNFINDVSEEGYESVLGDTVRIVQMPGTKIQRIEPLKKLTQREKDYFSKSEIEILETVCKRFYESNAEEIKEASHKEAAWNRTNLGEKIPYDIALKDKDCEITNEEMSLFMKVFNA